MQVQVVMPQMGENVKEGTIVKWHKAAGDRVAMDENILEISTDKVDCEIPSTAAGIVAEILVPEGETAAVGAPIALIETEAAQAAPAAATPAARKSAEGKKAKPRPEPAAAETAQAARSGRSASPLVRAIATREGITPEELSSIAGTGKDDRVTKEDVLSHLAARKGVHASQTQAPAAAPARESYEFGPDGTAVIPMDQMRKTIAGRLTAGLEIAAHATSLGEADLSNIVAFRERHKEAFEREHGFRLTYTPFFVRAAVEALQAFPRVNGSIDGDNIVLHRYVNVGIAVAIEGGEGLIVPVVKNAEGLSLVGLARAANDLTVRARLKKLSPADVQGGTFTVTDAGTLFTTPIINQPQAAILGVGVIRKRPVAVDDAIGIRPMVYLSLTFDHRLVDGALGGMFLQRVCDLLERFDPNTSL